VSKGRSVSEDGGRKGSSWWRDLMSIRRGVRIWIGCWFDDSLVRVVGDATTTCFLSDP
jgi:hypothetical protein